jgi:hypothetical protein
MRGSYHDDEWKKQGQTPKDPPRTRFQLQERLDWDFGTGKIDHETWSRRTDELSKPIYDIPSISKTDNGGASAPDVPPGLAEPLAN